MSVLNHIRILHKILIIVAILLLPIGYLLFQMIESNNEKITFSRHEVAGSELLLKMRDVMLAAAKGRIADIHKDDNPYAQLDEALAVFAKASETSPYVTKEEVKKVERHEGN